MTVPPLSVLFVDDEQALCDISKRYLEKDPDLVVDVSLSASDALESLGKKRYDVIVADYEMPGTNGIDLLRQLRAAGDATPFILFSGKVQEAVAIEALNNGVDFFIRKGGDPEARFAELKNQIHHIGQRKKAETAVKESEAKFRGVFDNANDAIGIHEIMPDGSPGRFIEVNNSMCTMLGYTREELLGMEVTDIIPEELIPRFPEITSEVNRSGRATFYTEHQRKNKTRYPVEISTHNFILSGRRMGISIARDITERKKNEEQTLASLHEKEVLLREIHHRVKNNLQIISSLLYLQSVNVSDPFTTGILMECRSRVKAMALIHEKLYRSKDLSHIPFVTYMENLIDSLKDSFGVTDDIIAIDISVDPPDLTLNVETGIPCGLLINELLSNALKYAFPGGRTGRIRLEMHRADPHDYTLIVSDNGAGFPKDVDFKNTLSLGLQLVNNLVTQLDGTITLDGTNGTTFYIRFRGIEDSLNE